jgi:hypothetical protein
VLNALKPAFVSFQLSFVCLFLFESGNLRGGGSEMYGDRVADWFWHAGSLPESGVCGLHSRSPARFVSGAGGKREKWCRSGSMARQ